MTSTEYDGTAAGSAGRVAEDVAAIEKDETRLDRDVERLEHDLEERHPVEVRVNKKPVRLPRRRVTGPLVGAVTPAVAEAVVDVRHAFPDQPLYAWPDGQRGAFVVIDDIDLGSLWVPARTWLGFVVSYLHPEADCYPHYVRFDLERADRQSLATPFHPGRDFVGHPAVMVSRCSRRRDPRFQTPARKALSVIEFVRSAA